MHSRGKKNKERKKSENKKKKEERNIKANYMEMKMNWAADKGALWRNCNASFVCGRGAIRAIKCVCLCVAATHTSLPLTP